MKEKKQNKYRVTNIIKIVESIFYDSHLDICTYYIFTLEKKLQTTQTFFFLLLFSFTFQFFYSLLILLPLFKTFISN